MPGSDMGKVSIIGHGNFGRLLAVHLAPHAEVVVHDAAPIQNLVPGTRSVELTEAASAETVILAVNVQHLEAVLGAIAPTLSRNALVADVCSVKVEPIEAMLRILPEHARILGTHPLFGPQSVAEKGLPDQRLAICPVRIDEEQQRRTIAFLRDTLRLDVIETSPEEHDRQMSLVQALTHLVGHAAAELRLEDLPLGTLAYRRLRQLAMNISGDSEELFDAIQSRNRFAAEIRARFVDAVENVRRRAGD